MTVSGNHRVPSLVGVLLEHGADRVLFAAGHPFEDIGDGAGWIDTVPISEGDREKIARGNAARLFRF